MKIIEGFVGMIVTMVIVFSILLIGYSHGQKPATQLIKQCEAELPRDQHCKLTAVPEVRE